MADCVVCQYWSERLEETRTHRRGKSALKQERRLMVSLRTHQFGACACKFPGLLADLVRQEPEQPDKAPAFGDSVHARILTDSRWDDFEVMPTYEWQ